MASETKTSAKAELTEAKFEILQLTKNQFDTLTERPNGKVLVFQFYYPRDFSPEKSPQLLAYVMNKGHKSLPDNPFVILTGTGNMSAEPVYGREQVLGDLQIEVSEIKALIRDTTGSEDGNYSALFFNPFFDDSNKHICYKITIDQQSLITSSKIANPSPPRSAV